MIHITINDKKAKLPTAWDELTFFQATQLIATSKFSEQLAALTNLDVSEIKNSKNVFIQDELLPYMQFLTEEPNLTEIPRPTKIVVNGKALDVPKDLGYLTFEQVEYLRLEARAYTEESVESSSDLLLTAVAIWVQPIYFETDFDEGMIENTRSLLQDCKFVDIIALGSFFFRIYIGLIESMPSDLTRFRRASIRSYIVKLVQKSLHDLAWWLRYIAYRKGTSPSGNKSSEYPTTP